MTTKPAAAFTDRPEPTAFAAHVASLCAPPPASAYVYSGYITTLIKAALKNDPQSAINPESVRIEHIGDAKYAVTCTDHNGTGYRVGVEVVR